MAKSKNQTEQKPKKQKLSVRIKTKKFWKQKGRAAWETGKILAVIAVFGILGIFLALGRWNTSPERLVKEYFGNYIVEDWDAMYQMLDIEESVLINSETFSLMMAAKKQIGTIEDYDFEEVKDSGDTLTYRVTYEIENNLPTETQAETQTAEEPDKQTEYQMNIVLKKQKRKQYGIFSTWKINIDEDILTECILSVPADVEARLDNQSLDEISVETENNNKTYVLDRVFMGTHLVTVNNLYIDSTSLTVDLKNDEEQIIFPDRLLRMKAKEEDLVKKRAENIVVNMYTVAMKKDKTFKNVSKKFDSEEAVQNEAKVCLEELSKGVAKDDGSVLSRLSFTSMDAYVHSYEYPSRVIVKVDFQYECQYTKGVDYLGDLLGKNKETGEDTATITMTYKNGDWVITGISLRCLEYGEEET